MNNNYPFFITIDEYLEAVHNAHQDYLKTRFSQSITNPYQTFHVEDLAVNSASFFESALILLDHFSTVIHNKVRLQKKQDEYEQYIKDKKTKAIINDPLWHAPSEPSEPTEPKKKFRKKK